MKHVTTLLFLVLFPATVVAQNPRDFIDGEFIGLETTLVYEENGKLEQEQYITRIGRLKRGIRAFPFSSVTSTDLNTIPTVGLAAEHWWLTFELNMLAQRNYGGCVDKVNLLRFFRGACALDDPLCDAIGALFIRSVRDYWVPFNIVAEKGAPTRELYIEHIEGGIDSLNVSLAALEACEETYTKELSDHIAYVGSLIADNDKLRRQVIDLSKKKKRKK